MKRTRSPSEATGKNRQANKKSLARRYQEICELRRKLELAATRKPRRTK